MKISYSCPKAINRLKLVKFNFGGLLIMRKAVVIGFMLTLSACGSDGVDEWSGSPNVDTNINMPSKPSNPPKPSRPNEQSRWQYSSVADGSRVFALSATTYSLNTYTMPKYNNLQGKPWVTLEKSQSRDGVVTDTIVIFADSNTACSPSCDVRMSFDGNGATYRMRNSIDGVLRPNDDATGKTLFKKYTSSNKATATLPIIGLTQPFEANFDLRGYDIKRMKF